MSIATLTSKGQVTLPKDIRTKLHLVTGEKIAFRYDEVLKTGVFFPMNKRVEEVFGMLKRTRPGKAPTVEEINDAIKDKFKKAYR